MFDELKTVTCVTANTTTLFEELEMQVARTHSDADVIASQVRQEPKHQL